MIDESKRRRGLGGSEVPAIFGADPRRTGFDVWLSKTGQLPPYAPNIQMRLGKLMERPLLELYREQTGRNVEPMFERTFTHPERPWQLYSPDGLVVDEQRGVEIKVVFWDMAHEWGDPPDEVPLRVELQCWHYMAALDYPVWDVFACINGDVKLYTVERDPEAEAIMLEREREWVERFLVRGEHPPIQHSEMAKDWLLRMYPRHKKPDLRPADEQEISLLEKYVDTRLQKDAAEDRCDELETTLKAAIGEREGLTWADGRFTWRMCKGRTVTNWEAIARGLLKLVDEETQKHLLDVQTYTKPGTRRIGLYSSRYREAVKEAAAVA